MRDESGSSAPGLVVKDGPGLRRREFLMGAGAIAPVMAYAATGGGGAESAASSGGGAIVTPAATTSHSSFRVGQSWEEPEPSPTPTPTYPTGITPAQASRFLGQASMGATKADIVRVQQNGFASWLTEQFAMPRRIRHFDWLVTTGHANAHRFIGNDIGLDAVMWSQLIQSRDTLRQRVGLALSEILVVGAAGANIQWRQFAVAAYFDVLLDGAFGNYRDLLEAVSRNGAMSHFLTFNGNRKANPQTGSQPDENYARELMQLFTIGLKRLNMDGSVQLGANGPIETYTQADVSGLARVFTGFAYDTPDMLQRLRRPLIVNPANHEPGAKSFLGTTIAPGTEGITSLKHALDTIFAHPNVPPFVSMQLIQRLVTSNPSRGYVGRVAGVFANNGQGVRGDLKAVIRAILLDPEARDDAGLTNNAFGKIREPVLRLTSWARAFKAHSPSNSWPIGNTSNPVDRLGQSPGRAPSVFNYFRPGYTPPNTPIAAQGLVAPEFQITNELSVIGYVNFMQGLIVNGAGDMRPDYGELRPLAGNSRALVDEVNLLLAAGQLSPATATSIRIAVDSIAMTGPNGPLSRIHAAILLTMASSDYLAQK